MRLSISRNLPGFFPPALNNGAFLKNLCRDHIVTGATDLVHYFKQETASASLCSA